MMKMNSLEEIKKKTKNVKNINSDEGFRIKPIKVIKANAKMATKVMECIRYGEVGKRDAILIMIPWLRAAIDKACDIKSRDEIKKTINFTSEKYSDFIFSANPIVHAFAENTLNNAVRPKNVKCSNDEWRNFCKDFCKKRRVPIYVPKNPDIVYQAIMELTKIIVGKKWVDKLTSEY